MTTVAAPSTTPNLQPFKFAVREQWDRSAQGWNDHTTEIRAWLRLATDAIDQTLDIAHRVGPNGRVLATDLSPAILAFTQNNARLARLHNIQTLVADGEELPVDPGSFDAVVCRLGLMLFPDPLQGLHSMHRALRPGGRICTLVFSRPDRNPCLGILISTALKHAGQPARDPFQPGGLLSLGKPGLADFVRASASPIQQILSRLTPEAANAAWEEMEERLGVFVTADGWVGPNELLLTAAQR
jgi:SAM-dependent methyltransferase